MSIEIVIQCRAKPGHSGELLALLLDLLPDEQRPEGCLAVQVRRNQEDENDIVAEQRWQSRPQAERWQADPRKLTAIRALVVEPLTVRYFEPVDPAIEADRPRVPAEGPPVRSSAPQEVPKVSTPDALGG